MEEGLGVTARPQQKIKLTPKAIDLAENSSAFLDPTSDTSGDDGKEAKSAIQGVHRLLGPGKEKAETQHYKSTKIYDFEYQHLDDEVTSDDGEVLVLWMAFQLIRTSPGLTFNSWLPKNC